MAVNRVFNRLAGLARQKSSPHPADSSSQPDFEPEDVAIIERVRPFTMTSPERVYALIKAIDYLLDRRIPGAVVECGVWRGGSMMAAASTLLRSGARNRELYLFDTYEGMPAPAAVDVDVQGHAASDLLAGDKKDPRSVLWAYAPEQDVRANLASVGYDTRRMHFIKGKVEDTVPGAAPEQIALLRLDTDWYESTIHALKHLYPRLEHGGVLIVDDYGHWRGARRAVDEYFEDPGSRPLLVRVDYTGRVAVKP